MAIGERIRFFRNRKGLTQKVLGVIAGFSDRTADIRIAQYESGSRTPKEDLVNALAEILDVSPLAINVPDIDSELGLIHTLFAVEDLYGAKVVKQGDEVHVVFDKSETNEGLYSKLSDWSDASAKLNSGEISKKVYDRFRYNYPNCSDFTEEPNDLEVDGLKVAFRINQLSSETINYISRKRIFNKGKNEKKS
ncbi:MAG: helix-turn-helix domain-containing protein [Clostridia bacterium]|nr:helix-turn-helix domain-containing protein [Clostridia bacterium]